MRFPTLIAWDMRFQARYGFYWLYGILTMLYLLLLSLLPDSWKGMAATICIFSDPAAMGLFFMGAVILLEQSQKVVCAIAISPISSMQYIWSKVISMGIISVLVALVLAITALVSNIHWVLLGTAASSVIFTLAGIIVATNISSLNQYILWTVPVEIIGFVPAVLYQLGIPMEFMQWYPPIACIRLVAGNAPSTWNLLIIIATVILLFFIANRNVVRMFNRLGGARI